MSSSGAPWRTPAALIDAGLLAPERKLALDAVAARYAVAAPRALAALIDPANPNDPLGLQLLPHESELWPSAEELVDPIGDHAHSPVKGVVHRYPDRVLLMPTTLCAVYCRFCFRRESVGPGADGMLGASAIEAALAYIAGRKEIFEVILTGGDPLVLSARRLGALLRRLAAIPHVKVLRIHTRVPIAAPERITPSLTNALRRAGRPVYVAVHANHPRELTPPARAALGRLADAGVPLLSQTVLLKGVNNDAEVLETLMRAFVELRIRPYYLHHPDLAPGTARFRLSLEEGRALVRALRGRVSGLCQPTYVLDVPGGHGKAPVAESFAAPSKDGGFVISSPLGGTAPYPPPMGAQETLAQTAAAKSSRARGPAPPRAAKI